jgi:hypothetical protein
MATESPCVSSLVCCRRELTNTESPTRREACKVHRGRLCEEGEYLRGPMIPSICMVIYIIIIVLADADLCEN